MTDGPNPARRRRFIVAAVLLPFLVLAALEGALRALRIAAPDPSPVLEFMNPEGTRADEEWGPIMHDPVLFWRLRPGWSMPDGNDRYSLMGSRTEFLRAKAPGVRRIACLGDSNTYGLSVAADRAWPAVLQRGFFGPQGGARWEVVNLGVPGYTSWQVRRYVETELGGLSPDVVTVECGAFNEWLPAVGAVDREQGRRSFWTKLHVVELLARAARPKTPKLSPEEAKARLADLRSRTYDGPLRVSQTEFEEDLVAVADWCGAHGARVVFVAHPLPATTVEAAPICLKYADVVRRTAARVGAPLADGWDAFARAGGDDDALFVDFCHPSPLGHEVMAQCVRQAVERLRW